MTQVWLVTGAGSGLGREIVQAVLKAGWVVVAGARRPEVLASLRDEYGERLLPVELDVRNEEACQTSVAKAVETFGQLDVLVNNAGYQFNAPFEQITSDRFRDVIETCLFGVVHMTRAVVPVMRRQRHGSIFQVSSIGGRVTIPGNSPYHAAKWAVGGFSDSLADEVGPFGVKVCTFEPGGIRTDFRRRASETLPPLLPDYEASVGPIYRRMADQGDPSENDPGRIADLLIRLSRADTVPKRLILGKAAKTYVERVEAARKEEMNANRAFPFDARVSLAVIIDRPLLRARVRRKKVDRRLKLINARFSPLPNSGIRCFSGADHSTGSATDYHHAKC